MNELLLLLQQHGHEVGHAAEPSLGTGAGLEFAPLMTTTLFGVAAGLVAVYVVLRGMSFIGDGLAHASFAGVGISWLAGWPLTVGALIWSVLAMLAIRWLKLQKVAIDAAIGIVFTFSFALGVVLVGTRERGLHELQHAIFGNVLDTGAPELMLVAGVTVVTLAALLSAGDALNFYSFDPEGAEAAGLNVGLLDLLLLSLVTLVIVAGVSTVGVLMVAALVITPASAALQITRRVRPALTTAGAIGGLSGLAGFFLSRVYNIESGATVVLVSTLLFFLCWGYRKMGGGSTRQEEKGKRLT